MNLTKENMKELLILFALTISSLWLHLIFFLYKRMTLWCLIFFYSKKRLYDVRFGLKAGKIGPKGDKSETFSEKLTDFSHLGPIQPTLDPNPQSGTQALC